LRELDKEYELTDDEYTIDDFIEDLKQKGYLREEIDDDGAGGMGITAKMEQGIRQRALDQIFGKLKRSGAGNHKTPHVGRGDEQAGEFREYRFGDTLERISMTESFRNAQINHGMDGFKLTEDDLVVEETQFKAQMSTVLMIDISHSMILYGEDRITPCKESGHGIGRINYHTLPKRYA
jgi:Ca-activated chloride channel family protein